MAVPSWRSSPPRRCRGGGGGVAEVGVSSGRRRKARRRFHRDWLLEVEPLEDRPLLAPFLFDADGFGPAPAQLISAFDFLPGDALADNSVPRAVGDPFQLYYHARLGGVIDTGGNSSVPAGLNTTYEITVVASITETVTALAPGGGVAAFQLAPAQAPNSFVALLFDATPDANPLIGSGFADGTPILTAVPTSLLSNAGTFTVALDPRGAPNLVQYDQFGVNNYPGIQTVEASGSMTIGAGIAATHPAFFQTPNMLGIAFAATTGTPFDQTDPSLAFFNGTIAPQVADIGPVNGITEPAQLNDFEFQADSNATVFVAGISLTKLTNFTDNNTPPGPIVPVGSAVSFLYLLTNTGDVPLSAPAVSDDNGTPGDPADDFGAALVGGDFNLNGLLDPGETWAFTASRIATPGQYTNTGTATAVTPTGSTVAATDVDNHFGGIPGIGVVKLTNGTDNNVAPGLYVPVNTPVTFTYIVTNTGNIPLSGVFVVDDNGTPANIFDDFLANFVDGDTNFNGLLDTDETWTFVAFQLAIPGQYSNTGTAVGFSGGLIPVVASDVDNHFGALTGIGLIKLANGTDNNSIPGPTLPAGSPITFTYVVNNPGNVPLGDIILVDDDGTPFDPADDFAPTFVGGDTNFNGLLDVSETWFYTADRVVVAGQYTNVATVTGTPPAGAGPPESDFDVENYFGSAPAIDLVKLTNGTDNNTAPGLFVPAGSTVTFTYVVTNTGNVPLSGVVVRDDNGTPGNPADDFDANFVGGDTNGDGLLDTTETWTFTASRFVTPGQYTNLATAAGSFGAGPPVTDADVDNLFAGTPAIGLVKLTNGTNNNAPTGPFVPVGSTVTFTYVVTNRGDLPLSAVVVSDDNGTPGDPGDDFNATFVSGDANGNGLLEPGETWTFRATRVATPGPYQNIATVSGTPPFAGPPVTDADADNHFGSNPAINLVKLTNGSDNNTAPGLFVPLGSPVTFTYIVTNPGNVPLSLVRVRDDNGTPGNLADDFDATFAGGDVNANGRLDTTETWTFTATRTAALGQHTNLATASGSPPVGGGAPVNDSDVDNYFGSTTGINLVKVTNGTDNNTAPGPFVPVGSTVTFTYVVTNTGNVPLSGFVVRDDNGTPGNPADDFDATFVGGDANADGLLDPAETWTFAASRTATPGQFTNVARATGTPPPGAGAAVADTDSDNHFGSNPAINVVKRTNGTDNNAAPGPLVPVGSIAVFSYVVTNTGNVPLSGVAVVDDDGTPGNLADDVNAVFVTGDANGNGQLDLTENWTFRANRTVTPGQYTNVATASGSPPPGGGAAVSDTDLDNHFGSAPAINLVKLTNGTDNNNAPGLFVPVGSTVTFTYVVTNPGNVPLSGVAVRDDNGTPGNAADDFNATLSSGDTNGNGLLDTGETWSFTATRTATAGQYTNLARVTGTPPPGAGTAVADTDGDNHFGSNPAINVVKLTNGIDNNNAPGPFIPVGSTVTFTYVVTNPGNVPLSGVSVRDDNGTPGNAADDFNATLSSGDTNGNGLLDTGETWSFTATRTATAGQYTNLATATGTPPPGAGAAVTDTDADNHFGSNPAIGVSKRTNGAENNTAPGPFVPVGQSVTFTYLVTNTGNLPLSGVSVRDDNGTPGNPADDFLPTLQSGDANGDGLLDTTETWTFTASRNATPGQHTNLATATGTPPPGAGAAVSATDSDNHFGSNPAINVVKQTGGTDNNSAPGPFVTVGTTVAFAYIVTNTGNLPLSGVVVRDDNGTPANTADDFNATFASGDTNQNSLLDTGETWTYTASRTATAGQYTNVATATGTPPSGAGAAVSDTDVDNHFGSNPAINLVKLTNGSDNNTAPGLSIPLGGKVTFTYVVTNPGNVPLSGILVVDDNGTPSDPADDISPVFVGGDANFNGQLETGETWTYSLSTIARVGQFTNVARVSGTPRGPGLQVVAGTPVTDSDVESYVVAPPGINLVKRTNGTDNNTAPGAAVRAGRPVTFTYTVTNTSNVPLAGISVRDDNSTPGNPVDDFLAGFVGGDANGNSVLDPTETWTFRAVRNARAGQNTNLATASGTPAGIQSAAVTDTDLDNYFASSAAAISLVKRTNGTNNDTPPGIVVPVGSRVVYTYDVSNTGDVPVSAVSVTDDNGTPGNTSDDISPALRGGDTNRDGLLDVDETWTYEASRIAAAGQHTNMALATAAAPGDGAGLAAAALRARAAATIPLIAASDVDNHFGRAETTFVTGVRRAGVHREPTRLVVSFNAPLDASRAQDPNNYAIVLAGRDGVTGTRDDRPLAVSSALYDPAANTVTLAPSQLINLQTLVQLTVRGTPPGGLTDPLGTAIDGDRDGQPGGDFVTTFRGFGDSAVALQDGVTAQSVGLAVKGPSLSATAVDAVLGGVGLRSLRRRARRA